VTELLKNRNVDNAIGHTVNNRVSVNENASAAPWWTWNNAQSDTTTDVLPSTRRPGIDNNMLHVCTTAARCGAGQVFAHQPGGGPVQATSSVWVFVLRGQMGVGISNAGAGSGRDVLSDPAKNGQWQHLTAPNGGLPANEFVLYAASPDGACFFADSPSVTSP
jgi:hypothetical protein